MAFSKLGGSPGGDPARSYQSIGHDLVGGRSPASRGVRHAVVLIAVVHAMPDFTAHGADVLEMPVVERLELGDHALLVAVFGEPGGKPRQKNALDRFSIDYSLCMYCGICVEVCPFEALFWSPEYEFSEVRIADLLHDKSRLGEWMETVPDFEPYEAGSEVKVKKVPRD